MTKINSRIYWAGKGLCRKWKKYCKSIILNRKKKVFCIGLNKTGTTSMVTLFRQLGYVVAPQRPAELLLNDWAENRYEHIIDFVRNHGNAFQDVPFSLPGTFIWLDKAFPKSKFILTVRDSPEVWYHSLTTFHAKIFGNGKIPDKNDLLNATYIYKGYAWDACKIIFNTPDNDPYNEAILKEFYLKHNNSVEEYFRNKPNKLLIINLKEPDAGVKIGRFLGCGNKILKVPWENKT